MCAIILYFSQIQLSIATLLLILAVSKAQDYLSYDDDISDSRGKFFYENIFSRYKSTYKSIGFTLQADCP